MSDFMDTINAAGQNMAVPWDTAKIKDTQATSALNTNNNMADIYKQQLEDELKRKYQKLQADKEAPNALDFLSLLFKGGS